MLSQYVSGGNLGVYLKKHDSDEKKIKETLEKLGDTVIEILEARVNCALENFKVDHV